MKLTVIILTDSMVPHSANAFDSESSVSENDKLPTYNFCPMIPPFGYGGSAKEEIGNTINS